MRNEAVTSTASDSAVLSETEKLIDDAVAHLGERDRNAVLLRFFGGRSLREVGEAMGVSEEAAGQRIFRAIEKLRAYFHSKGVTAESATISACLGMAVKPAGAELARAAVRLAVTKAAVVATIAKSGGFSHLAWTWPKLFTGIAAAVTVAAVVVVKSNGGTSPSGAGTISFNTHHAGTVAGRQRRRMRRSHRISPRLLTL